MANYFHITELGFQLKMFGAEESRHDNKIRPVSLRCLSVFRIRCTKSQEPRFVVVDLHTLMMLYAQVIYYQHVCVCVC